MDFYRYDDYPVYQGGHVVKLSIYKLVRPTKKGNWIINSSCLHYSERLKKVVRRWVSNTSVKRYAYPTREEALDGYIARKVRQIEICEYQLKNAKSCLLKANNMKERGFDFEISQG